MAIHEQMGGAPGPGGTVVLVCRTHNTAVTDAYSEGRILKVCSFCGTPLGEWNSVAERDAELGVFVEQVKAALKKNVPPGGKGRQKP